MRYESICPTCHKIEPTRVVPKSDEPYCVAECNTCFRTRTSAPTFYPIHDDQSFTVINPNTHINGIWENITQEPITITGGLPELKEVCNKHGVIPKSLSKPRSQGKGWDWVR